MAFLSLFLLFLSLPKSSEIGSLLNMFSDVLWMPRKRAAGKWSPYLGFSPVYGLTTPLWVVVTPFSSEGRWPRRVWPIFSVLVGVCRRCGQSKHCPSWTNQNQWVSWDFYYNCWDRELFWLEFSKEQEIILLLVIFFSPQGKSTLEGRQNRKTAEQWRKTNSCHHRFSAWGLTRQSGKLIPLDTSASVGLRGVSATCFQESPKHACVFQPSVKPRVKQSVCGPSLPH